MRSGELVPHAPRCPNRRLSLGASARPPFAAVVSTPQELAVALLVSARRLGRSSLLAVQGPHCATPQTRRLPCSHRGENTSRLTEQRSHHIIVNEAYMYRFDRELARYYSQLFNGVGVGARRRQGLLQLVADLLSRAKRSREITLQHRAIVPHGVRRRRKHRGARLGPSRGPHPRAASTRGGRAYPGAVRGRRSRRTQGEASCSRGRCRPAGRRARQPSHQRASGGAHGVVGLVRRPLRERSAEAAGQPLEYLCAYDAGVQNGAEAIQRATDMWKRWRRRLAPFWSSASVIRLPVCSAAERRGRWTRKFN